MALSLIHISFVQTLLQCYTDVTGKPGKAFAIGGGTYVHHLKNGVAFGCADLEVDNRMHGADAVSYTHLTAQYRWRRIRD